MKYSVKMLPTWQAKQHTDDRECMYCVDLILMAGKFYRGNVLDDDDFLKVMSAITACHPEAMS